MSGRLRAELGTRHGQSGFIEVRLYSRGILRDSFMVIIDFAPQLVKQINDVPLPMWIWLFIVPAAAAVGLVAPRMFG